MFGVGASHASTGNRQQRQVLDHGTRLRTGGSLFGAPPTSLQLTTLKTITMDPHNVLLAKMATLLGDEAGAEFMLDHVLSVEEVGGGPCRDGVRRNDSDACRIYWVTCRRCSERVSK